MHSVTGIFSKTTDAARALYRLHEAGFDQDSVNLLVPGSTTESVPVETAEQPGLGRAIGGVAGGAAGAAWGMQLLAAAAAGTVPGVGPVLAVGTVAGLLAGLGGAAAGQAIETRLTQGLPKDELQLYEAALRQGRAVVIVMAPNSARAEDARAVMAGADPLSIDVARAHWWVGLKDQLEPVSPRPRSGNEGS
jgi:hypothetical protein